MIGSRTPLVLVTLLLFGSGALLLLLGNALAILVAFVALLASSLFCGGTSSRSAWVCSLGAIGIFLAGTPLAGAAPEGILISAVMALYFVCFVQQLKVAPLDATSPTGPYTLTFYGTLLIPTILSRLALNGLRTHSSCTEAIHENTFTSLMNSKLERHTMTYGMPRKSR